MSRTFRLKVSLAIALVVIVLVVAIYLVTVLPLAERAAQSVQNGVDRASVLVSRSQKLEAFELMDTAESVAARAEFVSGVQLEEEKERRINVYDALNQQDKKLKSQGRKPDFFGVVDAEGKVIARDLDPNNMYGEKLDYRSVARALQGKPTVDIWRMKNAMMRAAAAPILHEGKAIGAVALAYEITAAEAREERDQFGTHVAYFMDGSIRASSFSLPGDDSTEDAARVAALARQLFGGDDAMATKALTSGEATDIKEIVLQDETYLVRAAPLPVRLTNNKVGYVVAASLTSAHAPVNRVRWMFLLLGIAVLILSLGSMYLVARHFVDAEDKLELGVSEVINGNMEYTFEAQEEFEGLANALNVMLARLLGRPEPGEEEEGEAAWRADVIFVGEAPGSPSEEQLAAQLASEPEDAYLARLYNEYVAARQKINLSVEGITPQDFAQKVTANQGLLKAKYECPAIRFVVKTEMGKVSLIPIRIR